MEYEDVSAGRHRKVVGVISDSLKRNLVIRGIPGMYTVDDEAFGTPEPLKELR